MSDEPSAATLGKFYSNQRMADIRSKIFRFGYGMPVSINRQIRQVANDPQVRERMAMVPATEGTRTRFFQGGTKVSRPVFPFLGRYPGIVGNRFR